MAGNPKNSKWRSTPRSARRRRGIEIMLDESTRAAIEGISLPGEAQSRTIERILREAAGLGPLSDAHIVAKKKPKKE